MTTASELTYLSGEARARIEIDRMLTEAGWAVQDKKRVNLSASPGVAVREFVHGSGHGRSDYALYVDRQLVGALEAKPEGTTLTEVEPQTKKYVTGVPNALPAPLSPLPFGYESTGKETRFTCFYDPEPRSRGLFWFHRPETLAEWIRQIQERPDAGTLRAQMRRLPPLDTSRLWPAQAEAIRNLEAALAADRPRSLIQMATGAGKTYTAANVAYRLIKYADARRILFLVDRAHLGKQAETEFQGFTVPETGRKFTQEYTLQRLQSNTIDTVARVCISTVQRMYSILKGDAELDPEIDEHSIYELPISRPVEVTYNPKVPIDTFDVVVVDECHRSIYGLWRQIIDYFDAHFIGLTATPTKQTLGFFNQNLVMEYSHDRAVADGVNVDFTVYIIRTAITERGSTIDAETVTSFRNRETRKLRWEKLDESLTYAATELDRAVVAKDQLRTVIRTFRDRLFLEIFPGRTTVPKTLIFAKDDSHADDIVQITREEFERGNDFCQKITYRTLGKKPEDILQAFRNQTNPRVVVTVDMIATGTDVKPVECLIFMRDVKSRTYFEQMCGRGVRIINPTDFQAVTPDAKTKDRFVIVDAVGVTEHELRDIVQPLDRRPRVATDKLLNLVALGNREADLVSTIASRLARLERQIGTEARERLRQVAGGVDLQQLVQTLVTSVDPDAQLDEAIRETGRTDPIEQDIANAARRLIDAAVEPLASNPELRQLISDAPKLFEQAIDEVSQDTLLNAGHSEEAKERAGAMVRSFHDFLEDNRDEIRALQILYQRPAGRHATFRDLKELAGAIKVPPRLLTPDRLWRAYEALDKSRVRGSGGRMLTDLVSLVRFELAQENELVPFREVVHRRFDRWLAKQAAAGATFTPEQFRWLEWMRDVIATDLDLSPDSFEYPPFIQHGGLGRAHQVFGDKLSQLMTDLVEDLAA